MIRSERAQNTILVITIIAAVVSSVLMVNSSSYYTGSYELIGRMDVEMLETRVYRIDPLNDSIDPRVSITFNMQTEANTEGSVRLDFVGADVYLNDDYLSYMDFAHVIAYDDQPVDSNFDRNFTMRDTASGSDKDTILDAYAGDNWNWFVRFRYSFYTFDEVGSRTFRWIEFEFTTTTIG